jgi:hypothetical protein
MDKDSVVKELDREPYVPLRLRLSDGRLVDVPFRHVAVPLKQHLLVFKGVKTKTSRQATGYDVLGYQLIERVEPRRASGGRGRRKAS